MSSTAQSFCGRFSTSHSASFDGLAQNTLIALASCFSRHDESTLDATKSSVLKESILTLMDAAGGFAGDESLHGKSPHELLVAFSVGTERGKSNIPAPPDPSKLGPIRNYRRVSPASKAKVVLKMKEEAADRPAAYEAGAALAPIESRTTLQLGVSATYFRES